MPQAGIHWPKNLFRFVLYTWIHPIFKFENVYPLCTYLLLSIESVLSNMQIYFAVHSATGLALDEKKSFQLLCAPMKWFSNFPFIILQRSRLRGNMVIYNEVYCYKHKCYERSIFWGDYHVQFTSVQCSVHSSCNLTLFPSISQLSHLFNHRIG